MSKLIEQVAVAQLRSEISLNSVLNTIRARPEYLFMMIAKLKSLGMKVIYYSKKERHSIVFDHLKAGSDLLIIP